MSLTATYKKLTLHFRFPAGTSRGVLHRKDSWLLRVTDSNNNKVCGYGECGPLPGLSPDDRPDFEEVLSMACDRVGKYNFSPEEVPTLFPSVRFGLETALKDLANGGRQVLFPSPFTEGRAGLSINGLIWMGDPSFIREQIRQKISEGYQVIKIKVGALDFEEELRLLKHIRQEYAAEHPELRLDANGAFTPGDAPEKLQRLAEYEIHSLEQPIAPGQYETMARLCESSPIPIALDEELIGLHSNSERERLLDLLHPAYIILKPTLLGGFRESEQWITFATAKGIGWWVTSLLESNLGLNALAQWTYTLGNPLPQGLGTGMLYTNNIESPLVLRGGQLFFDPDKSFDLNPIWQS
jgi:o-succinylbenzoate synthase